MIRRILSSRRRFTDYLKRLRERNAPGNDPSSGAHEAPAGEAPRKRPRLRSTGTLLSRFWRLIGDVRGSVVFALALVTVSTLLGLVPPAATKFVIDYVLIQQPLPESVTSVVSLPTDSWQLLCWVTGLVFGISALRMGLQVSSRWLATRSNKRFQLSLRRRLFEHTVRLPLHRVQELKSGGVASILRDDVASVGDLIFGMLFNPWRAVIQLLGSLIVLAWVDWRMLLGTLILIPMVFITHRTWIRRIRPQYRDIRARRVEVDSQATEIFGGMRVVRAFSGQRQEAVRFMKANHLMGRQELYTWWWARILETIWEILVPLGSAALLLYGGWQVIEGSLSVGDLMMFMVYLLLLLEPAAVLASSATQFQNGLSALDRLLDLFEEPREMQANKDTAVVNAGDVAGQIQFRNVSFSYPGAARPALNDVSLDIAAGEVVALVGPSGAGKTTLCNLVARFYDATEGVISLDGRPITDIDVEAYRGLLGVVEQDVFLFDGTIAENIGYATRHITLAEIRSAAAAANALEFIERLPEGFDSVIGERGVKLSGGQRQRLAIARAIVADPRILILDEATSNLDTESERLIQESLTKLMRGRTSFVIAHRLSTISHADRIIVIDDGRIVEMGRHQELMADGGRYRDMVTLQIGAQQSLSDFATEGTPLPR